MEVLEFFNKKVYVTGDVHGKLSELIYYLKNMKISNSIIIIAGDIGLGFEKKGYYTNLYRSKMKNFLEKNDVTILCIRGNHDDPSYFNTNNKIKTPRFVPLSDYSILKFYYTNDNNQNELKNTILCIGGATSIDRTSRMFYDYEKSIKHYCKTPLKTYWENEHPFYDEKLINEFKENGVNINTIISHTCPSFAFPRKKDGISYWCLIDPSLENDLNIERGIMDDIYNKLFSDGHNIKKWYYGHYHTSNEEEIYGILFRVINCINFKFELVEIT